MFVVVLITVSLVDEEDSKLGPLQAADVLAQRLLWPQLLPPRLLLPLYIYPPPPPSSAPTLLIQCTRTDQRFYAPQYKLLGYSICVSRSTVRNDTHATHAHTTCHFPPFFGTVSDWSTLGQALVMEWNSFLLLMTVCRNVITWYVVPFLDDDDDDTLLVYTRPYPFFLINK
mgnify:CR=1 FL=1